jgi:hypothetical protein
MGEGGATKSRWPSCFQVGALATSSDGRGLNLCAVRRAGGGGAGGYAGQRLIGPVSDASRWRAGANVERSPTMAAPSEEWKVAGKHERDRREHDQGRRDVHAERADQRPPGVEGGHCPQRPDNDER